MDVAAFSQFRLFPIEVKTPEIKASTNKIKNTTIAKITRIRQVEKGKSRGSDCVDMLSLISHATCLLK